jgi:hypothetical protein
MFFTRPELPVLDLDLIEVRGYSGLTSDFRGRTSDGRPVNICYKSGWLSIEQGAPGADHYGPMTTLLEAGIGDPLHGEILIEQVCDLTGITIRGERQSLSEEKRRGEAEHGPILDFSGRTTYWRRQLLTTRRGVRTFIGALAHAFPDLRILDVQWDEEIRDRRVFSKRRFVLRELSDADGGWLCFGGDEAALERILSSPHVRLSEIEEAFAHTVSCFISPLRSDEQDPSDLSWADSLLSRRLGRKIVFARSSHARLETQFATHDPQGRAFVQKVIEIADACFSNRFEVVDLETGEAVIRECDYWCSPDLADWSRAGPDRYLVYSTDDDSEPPRPIGYRAIPHPKGII